MFFSFLYNIFFIYCPTYFHVIVIRVHAEKCILYLFWSVNYRFDIQYDHYAFYKLASIGEFYVIFFYLFGDSALHFLLSSMNDECQLHSMHSNGFIWSFLTFGECVQSGTWVFLTEWIISFNRRRGLVCDKGNLPNSIKFYWAIFSHFE